MTTCGRRLLASYERFFRCRGLTCADNADVRSSWGRKVKDQKYQSIAGEKKGLAKQDPS
jgi:hypothetical protein